MEIKNAVTKGVRLVIRKGNRVSMWRKVIKKSNVKWSEKWPKGRKGTKDG